MISVSCTEDVQVVSAVPPRREDLAQSPAKLLQKQLEFGTIWNLERFGTSPGVEVDILVLQIPVSRHFCGFVYLFSKLIYVAVFTHSLLAYVFLTKYFMYSSKAPFKNVREKYFNARLKTRSAERLVFSLTAKSLFTNRITFLFVHVLIISLSICTHINLYHKHT